MATLEAEVLLLGIWKNIQDLEESLSLPELEVILAASREKEHREHKFLAALKGIDLDEDANNEAKNKFEEVQRRVQAKLHGGNEKQLEMDIFGLDIETEEE